MTEEIISDAVLTEKLQNVFGIGNVVSADRSTGYHEIFFRDEKAASETLRILDEQGFGDYLEQSLDGCFVAIHRPNIWVTLGNESQRSKDTELNQAAFKMINALSANKDTLQTAAGISTATYRE